MKLVFAVVFLAFYLSVGVDPAVSIQYSISNETLTLHGTADVHLNVSIGEIWARLSEGHRYPTINSGDTIALRSAYSSGSYSKYWLYCYTSYCKWYTCPGTYITPSKWSSCPTGMMFVITAMGKQDGQPINSGDTVSLSSKAYGTRYRLYCSSSSGSYCCANSVTSSMTGSNWLKYSYATFQIFSKNADFLTPVQYGDVVGFKFPYSTSSAWLSQYTYNRFYPRSCSSTSKTPCAAENTRTGFRIFKKL